VLGAHPPQSQRPHRLGLRAQHRHHTDGQTTYFRTDVSTRTVMTGTSPWVAFEIDGLGEDARRSVLVKGHTHQVVSQADDDVIDSFRSHPVRRGPLVRFVRLDPTEVTGWATFPDL
jgi:hypothetical protein